MERDLFYEIINDKSHEFFKNMKNPKSEEAERCRNFCSEIYRKFDKYFDKDFKMRFPMETPARFSEMFFMQAFVSAGWDPVMPSRRIDFRFRRAGSRDLVVEVVTPELVDGHGHVTALPNGMISREWDGSHREKALLRLTSAFYSKYKIIEEAISRNYIDENDYRIIGISGLRVRVEGGWSLGYWGNPPDFAEAFLPIGKRYYDIPLVGGLPDLNENRANYSYSDTIKRDLRADVRRDAFVSGNFPKVNAIAYANPDLLDFEDVSKNFAVLHNSSSSWRHGDFVIGCGQEYFVGVAEGSFSITRKLRPDLVDE